MTFPSTEVTVTQVFTPIRHNENDGLGNKVYLRVYLCVGTLHDLTKETLYTQFSCLLVYSLDLSSPLSFPLRYLGPVRNALLVSLVQVQSFQSVLSINSVRYSFPTGFDLSGVSVVSIDVTRHHLLEMNPSQKKRDH